MESTLLGVGVVLTTVAWAAFRLAVCGPDDRVRTPRGSSASPDG